MVVYNSVCTGLQYRVPKIKFTDGEIVTLVPEPTNKYDDKAIKVQNKRGKLIGYVSRQRNVSYKEIDNEDVLEIFDKIQKVEIFPCTEYIAKLRIQST